MFKRMLDAIDFLMGVIETNHNTAVLIAVVVGALIPLIWLGAISIITILFCVWLCFVFRHEKAEGGLFAAYALIYTVEMLGVAWIAAFIVRWRFVWDLVERWWSS